VAIADDHDLLRDGIARILSDEADIEVVGEGQDAHEAVELAIEHSPDVILLDAEMPGPAPHLTVPRIHELSPGTRVIILTAHADPVVARTLMALGPRGYITKDVSGIQLVSAIRTVMRGTRTVAASSGRSLEDALDQLAVSEDEPLLTRREQEVLMLAARGLTNRQIAMELFVATGTVHRHLSSAYHKLGAANRVDAIRLATDVGAIPPTGTPPPAWTPAPAPDSEQAHSETRPAADA
jgi:DNA-binding NarL/FixJ family response regulator